MRVRFAEVYLVRWGLSVQTRPRRERRGLLLTNISREELLPDQLSVDLVIDKEQYCFN